LRCCHVSDSGHLPKKKLEAFTGGSRAVQQGLNKMYADQANWPSTFKKPYSDEVGAFICQAMALRKKG